MVICLIKRNQGFSDSVMYEFNSSVNKVNNALPKVRTIGDRLPLISIMRFLISIKHPFKVMSNNRN